MSRCLSALIFAGVISSAAAIPSAAVEPPARIALLIGDWDYNLNHEYEKSVDPNSGFERDLKKPCEDVDTVEKALLGANFAKRNVLKYCNALKKDFDDQVAAIQLRLKNLPPHSVVFVYYAGHGMQYHGFPFLLPVKFNSKPLVPQGPGHITAAEDNLNYLRQNAYDLELLFQKIADSTDAAVIFALDDCRNNPISEGDIYNDNVGLHPKPNSIVQYSTTPGDTVQDSSGYAEALAEEIRKGGEIVAILNRVDVRMRARFLRNQRETYVDTNGGQDFASIKPTPLDPTKTLPTKEIGLLPVQHKKIQIRGQNNKDTNFDILWCEGPGEERRYAVAHEFGEKLAARASDLKLGRVWLVPLSEEKNAHDGYGNVQRNIMRYDVTLDKDGKADPNSGERPALLKIAQMFPEYSFMPRRGVGMRGHDTKNYVSAFVCGPQ